MYIVIVYHLQKERKNTKFQRNSIFEIYLLEQTRQGLFSIRHEHFETFEHLDIYSFSKPYMQPDILRYSVIYTNCKV